MSAHQDGTGDLKPDTNPDTNKWIGACLQVLLLAGVAAPALAQTNLRGTVHDANGAPAAGSTVKLTCDETPALSAQTLTAADGTYRFAALAPCRYQVNVQQQQLIAAPLAFAVTADTGSEAQLDVTLAAGTTPAGIPSSAATTARPKFAASGIRGLIDPGGYSAPANAAAASGLLTGMADVNRSSTSCVGGCHGKMLAELQSAHEKNPGDTAATLNLAEALVTQQQFERARALLITLPQSQADTTADRRLLRMLARVDEGTGEFAAASLQYHRVASIEPSAENAFAEGYELILAGQTAAAAVVYRDSLRLYPRSATLLIGAGTTEFLQKHTPEAITLFLRAAAADPADPRPYPFLAAASGVSNAEKEEEVVAAMQRHLVLVPRAATAHLALAIVLLHGRRAGQPATAMRAEAELRQALGIDPALADAHFQLGKLLARRGAGDEAIREFELTLQLNPTNKEAHYQLALALRKTGQTDAAVLEMQRFQQARAEDAAEGSDVRQYLSVMKQTSTHDSSGMCEAK